MTTLITGGAGFIGSQLAARLLRQGQPVVILDNFDDYYDPAIKRANVAALGQAPVVIEGDIRDRALVERLFDQHGITRVAHMAALAGVRNSVEQGPLYAEVNTVGSTTLMDIARRRGLHVFVQASTSSVYGQAKRLPFSEDDAPDFPLAPYPASKRAAELFAYTYHQLFGLNVTVLRFFNVYGPSGRPDMMPIKVIESILNDRVITVYDEGRLERDWTYIDDIIAGVAAALERPMGYQLINLGCGAPIPLTEFIHIYERLIGKKALTRPAPAPASEPRVTYCDNSRARALLDFEPKIRIEEGLARTWEWYRSYHGVLTDL
ncbi:MAG: NAD-dependent epimerase/dehydratase family protein [Chloroflexi bacterium]|nr:NAD-dependent epimerase/dehydratase family protein [Chloroflexota bacterium]MDL1882355.1 NAD-dependent epimerase/dehydratase family protein [Anaerolineae bacterium CFX8]